MTTPPFPPNCRTGFRRASGRVRPVTGAKTAKAAPGPAVERGMAELVILAAFFRVGQYAVSLRHFFKLFFCLRVARIVIRMIFFCQGPVCLFQCGIVGILWDAQNLVIISLTLCHGFLHLVLNAPGQLPENAHFI